MKIFSAAQIREADNYTIKKEPVSSLDLMERASEAFVKWFVNSFPKPKNVSVVCGTGNNGGDGMVIARLLMMRGWIINVFVVRSNDKETSDFKTNYLKVKEILDVTFIETLADVPKLNRPTDILIDAIFGSGLTRPVAGIYKLVIEAINHKNVTRVSVDVPSGMFTDKSSAGNTMVMADAVVSFQMPKTAFFMPENAPYCADLEVVDIGLSKAFIDNERADFFLIDKHEIPEGLKQRKKFDHKGTAGHALLISGSYGKMGAANLCSRAALRSGVGLVTIHTPACGYEIMQSSVPEAMLSVDITDRFISSLPELTHYDAIGIGPGINIANDTIEMVMKLFNNYRKPIVIDADALNIIATHKELLRTIPPKSILTPHPGEFKRLTGGWTDDFDKIEQQREMSIKYNIFIVLKGAYTTLSTPKGKILFNPTGNPGMATAGSGDVLTGVITSLLAQGYTSKEAAKLGVYLHGMAGDIAMTEKGEYGMIASDIINRLPDAFRLNMPRKSPFK